MTNFTVADDDTHTLRQKLMYALYPMLFALVVIFFYAVAFRHLVSYIEYFLLVIIFVAGVAACLSALFIMQKYHLNLKYQKIIVNDKDSQVELVGVTRFLKQKETIFSFNMNEAKALTLFFELHDPESYQIVLWNSDPDMELTYFGLEQHNKEAKPVFNYSIPALMKNPPLQKALKTAFTPYVESGQIKNELDLTTWKRLSNARHEGVELLDTGVIQWRSTQREDSAETNEPDHNS